MTAPIATKKRTARGSKPGERRGGRKPGTPNKVTQDFRETVRLLLETNATTVSALVDKLAWGVATGTTRDGPFLLAGKRTFNLLDVIEGRVPADVGVEWLVGPEPDKALQRICGLAEYAAPKLTRTEVVGDAGGPVQVAAVEWHVVDPAGA